MNADCCEYLPWDSAHFGIRIARVKEHRLEPGRLQHVLQWCREHRIECLYLLAEADDDMTVELAEANRFHLVDVRLTLKLCLDKAPHANGRPAFIRPIRPVDLEALRAIARDSHRQSRFLYDHQFAASRTEDLYERWIEASASGYADAVWIGEQDGKPGGYVSCHLSPDGTGRIGLLAVSAAARGKGLARAMLAASLDYFREQGMNRVSVVTQGRNVAAQRLYQRCGFQTESLQLWYHRWFLPNGEEPGPPAKGTL